MQTRDSIAAEQERQVGGAGAAALHAAEFARPPISASCPANRSRVLSSGLLDRALTQYCEVGGRGVGWGCVCRGKGQRNSRGGSGGTTQAGMACKMGSVPAPAELSNSTACPALAPPAWRLWHPPCSTAGPAGGSRGRT